MSVDRLDLGDHVCWTFDDDERLAAMARLSPPRSAPAISTVRVQVGP